MSGEGADAHEGAPHPRQARRLVGQDATERSLIEAYRAGRLPHALILGGPPGIGKATLAWRLAKFLFHFPDFRSAAVQAARRLDIPPTSAAFSQVVSLSHPDLVLLRRELNDKTKRLYTEIRAEDVRRVTGLFQRAAGAGGYRICLIDSAEDLNRSSANALLKIIEEPPPASLFILIAHKPGLILPTIRSRAPLFRLDPLRAEDIVTIIQGLGPPWSEMETEAIRAAADQAGGSVRDALRRLASNGVELGTMAGRLLDRLPAVDWRDVHRLADGIGGREGDDAFDAIIETIFDWLARVTRGAAPGSPRRLAPYADVWEKIAQSVRETEALNLDRRRLVLSVFADLAAAVRASSA